MWESPFNGLAEDPDFEYVIVDPTIVRAHHHAAGKRGILRSRDRPQPWRSDHQNPRHRRCHGNPIRFLLIPGQRNDITQTQALIEGQPAEHVLADKAYDADYFRGAIAVFPSIGSTQAYTIRGR